MFVSTVVGVINVLTLASSVDAVDGQLLGVLLYAALPGIVGFVLSFYARIHGRGVWFGLVAVHVWLVIGSLATLGAGDDGVSGLPQLVMPVAVVVLLLRPAARGWFRLPRAERYVEPRFRGRELRLLVARRDGGQTAMEYLGLVLIVAALVGAITATTVGTQLTGEIRNALCQLTGGACSPTGSDVVAGGESGVDGADSRAGAGGSAGADGSDGSGVSDGSSGSSAVGGTQTGTEGATGAVSDGGADTSGSTATAGGASTTGSTATAGSDSSTGGTSTSAGGTGTSTGGTGTSTGGTSTGAADSGGTATAGTTTAGTATRTTSTTTPTPGFFESLVGDGLGGDLRGVARVIGSPVKSVTGVVDQWSELTGAARDKWAAGDHAGAVGAFVEASGGVGVGGMGLPGSGPRVVAAVREDERQYLNDRIPVSASAADRKAWWDGLSQAERGRYLELSPERIGNLDGIPAAVRDQANRKNLRTLITELEGKADDKKAKKILEGMKEIDRQLKEGSQPPMFLLGIGAEGNGRAIVSYGSPDLSQHVSAYVPGLNTSLDREFAQNDLKRARDTAIGAQGYEPSSASIVWLGYDAPQLPDSDGIAGYFAIMGTGRAEKGGTAYDDFWSGLTATNTNKDPHFTAIGHSYGSRTVGAATQREGGIPGVDDIILVGSPGVGVDRAVDLGVGARHVFVGAAANDPVTKLPSRTQAIVGSLGMLALGPAGAYVAGDLADPGDDDLWFGKDPASKAFGAVRFPVDAGPPVISGHGISAEAHSQYFDPVRDAMSADAIALIVSGHSSNLKIEEQR
ncbi:alpha/beta hydrolase [Streptomyces sp. NPDC060184]|uniref:alpha/beta hydrolase n=1 Tax=Streptomyces sp. NPDC060184 TaxID=3347064 RepID=UPI0036649BB8